MADATIENTIKPKRTYIKKKDKPSVENSNDTNKPKRAYRKKIKVPIDEKTVDPPAEKMEELSAEKMEEPPAEKMEELPAEIINENINENKNENKNKSNKKKSLPAKYEKFLLYGVHILKHIIDSELTIDKDNILSISKICEDVDSQIQFVDSFMNQIKNTKSFVKNYNNNNNNNPFVDSLVKLANLNVNENENDQIHCQVFEFNKHKYLIDQHFNVRPLDNSNSIIGKFDIVSMNLELY